MKIEENKAAQPEVPGKGDQDWSVKDVQGKAKIGYIWAYYKFPIIIGCVFLYIAVSMLHGFLTRKDTVLYTALVNVPDTIPAGELTTDFLDYLGADKSKNEVVLYEGLHLTDDEASPDYAYVYASNTKLTAVISAGQLDVVLMDREAFDLLSARGCLCDMEKLLLEEAPDLYEALRSRLAVNTVIIEDNAFDVQLDADVTYRAVTEEYPMGIDLTGFPLLPEGKISGALYLGVISNAPHTDTAVAYLRYLTG